mgnify:CR=1 FL=1
MIRILTDSASDILPAEAEQLGVTVIPLNVTLEDGTVLRDGIDKTPSEYYALLKECHKLPTTSQPSPELFERFYQDAAAAGDEVLGIFLSHELSGTWQCARLAADLVNVDNVLFVDSANVCLGEGLLVRLAVQLRAAGRTLVQIATDLAHAKEHLHLVAAIDDLKYLRKGGRLPAAVAVAGGMLGIKPLITIKEGKVAMAGKARGLPGAYVALFKKAFPTDKDPVSFDNMARAIEVFEATLITPDARFDTFLKGDAKALSDVEKEGRKLIRANEGGTRHGGVNMGGDDYYPLGVVSKPREEIIAGDKGRFAITEAKDDEFAFKSPSLRNIELTPPYFHSGVVWSLEESIEVMNDSQVGADLKEGDIGKIAAFLRTTTGKQPQVVHPILPAPTATTPLPSLK